VVEDFPDLVDLIAFGVLLAQGAFGAGVRMW